MTPLTLSPARVQQLYDTFLDDAKEFILANEEMETSALLEGAKKYALARAVEREQAKHKAEIDGLIREGLFSQEDLMQFRGDEI